MPLEAGSRVLCRSNLPATLLVDIVLLCVFLLFKYSTRLGAAQVNGKCKGSVGSCPRVLHVSFSCVPEFSLVLDIRDRVGGLIAEVGSAHVRTMKRIYSVNVSVIVPIAHRGCPG